jgi:hypothetical protein
MGYSGIDLRKKQSQICMLQGHSVLDSFPSPWAPPARGGGMLRGLARHLREN